MFRSIKNVTIFLLAMTVLTALAGADDRPAGNFCVIANNDVVLDDRIVQYLCTAECISVRAYVGCVCNGRRVPLCNQPPPLGCRWPFVILSISH